MASGHPDWGQAQQTGLIATVSDLGELAARLGSIDTFYRTGNVIFLDDFDNGAAGWQDQSSGVGSSTAAVAGPALSAPNALQLVAGGALNRRGWRQRQFNVPTESRTGIEIAVALNSAAQFRFGLEVLYGAELKLFELMYDVSTGNLSYLGPNGITYVTLATALNLGSGLYQWHYFKLIVDPVAGEYVQARVDYHTYALTSIAVTGSPSGGSDAMAVDLIAQAIDASGMEARVDNFIFTINEP